jgi:RimJ/RimL family protein N-acetyltransferase
MGVRLRLASEDDEARLLRWRNEPETRRASFSAARVSATEHARWFRNALADPDCLIFVIEVEGNPSGQVRLTKFSPDEAEIHIGLTRSAHGQGIGRGALRSAVLKGCERLRVDTIVARVREDNEASLRAFEAAGFREVGRARGVVELRVGR